MTMEKTRVRAISGWRQVHTRPGIGGRRLPAKAFQPTVAQPSGDPGENARWEGEGGTLKK